MLISARERQFLASSDPEGAFFRDLEQVIGDCRPASPACTDAGSQGPFRPLLVGYSGAGNIGSDIRVAEMIRQFRVIFAHTGFDPSLTAMGKIDEPFFHDVRQVPMHRYFPDFLVQQHGRHDAVIVCEGSMFTSTFSDLLTAIFAASIGYAARQGIPGIGYGATAGRMSARLQEFVSRTCRDGYVLCRSRKSERLLEKLGVRSAPGADPAWTFEPNGANGRELLTKAGWNGSGKVVAVCPINPFWWPVEIDFSQARAMLKAGEPREEHFRSFLFHRWSEQGRTKYDRYLDSLAASVEAWRKQGHFVVLVGMERSDRKNCADLRGRLGAAAPEFVSGDFGMDAICAVLRTSSLVVSSRFHATVLALSAGVPVIGITMDNRISDLYSEHGLDEWAMESDAPDLGERLQLLGERLLASADEAKRRCERITALQIREIGRMGIALVDHLAERRPGFKASPLPRSWDEHLPPLSGRLAKLLAEGL